MLRGNYTVRMDEKGRIKLPAAYRRYIDEHYGSEFYVTSLPRWTRRGGFWFIPYCAPAPNCWATSPYLVICNISKSGSWTNSRLAWKPSHTLPPTLRHSRNWEFNRLTSQV